MNRNKIKNLQSKIDEYGYALENSQIVMLDNKLNIVEADSKRVLAANRVELDLLIAYLETLCKRMLEKK
ncbi:hypothetical protein [Klebsiella aerogenes]|uniref:hypothetical protein n=1 Tax=Klebsiella aerogenes TaxID=548 RepID=UPI0019062B10|nr:hypothetical protein [Klebsiella aerogenes]MBK0469559.1 hypothetical protein [Klebsiella aerogenes]MDT8881002.1 hypothetical protein [Klebsiella aerogenes]HBU8525051.1 hypothetical protein [Klebsiella aerogenes]